MTYLLIAALAVALAGAVLALCREVRLRRALVRLLTRIISRWRNDVQKSNDRDLDH